MIPLTEQIECVRRELRFRERVYARRVNEGVMGQKQATWELERMRAVLATLLELEEKTRLI